MTNETTPGAIHIPLRQLDNTYSQAIVDLILPIQQQEFGIAITKEDQPDLMEIEEFYLAPGGGFWGAFDGHRLVGTIALINIGHGTGAIRKMFVRAGYRGKEHSIAQRLFDTLKEAAREKGMKTIYLGTTEVMKAAQRFYERNGFSKVSKESLPAYFPLMAADNVFYQLNLEGQQ